MRILQIIPSISLVYGGPSQMVLGLSKALAQTGVEVTVITTDANGDVGQAPLEVPLGIAIDQSGYQIWYFRCAPFQRYKFSLDLLQWLNHHAQNYDVAHIHALFSPVSTVAATLCRAKGLPYLLRPLGTLDPADLQKKRLFKQLYGHLLEKPNLAGAAAVHFTTAMEAEVSERFGARTRDVVVPLGVEALESGTRNSELGREGRRTEDGGRRTEGDPSELANRSGRSQVTGHRSESTLHPSPVILFLSRLDPKKGLDVLIPALSRLRQEGFGFRLILAGANPQDPEYEARVKAEVGAGPLADCTTFTGFVRGEAKRSLLATADLFVLPSYYENFGIAVAEAMVAGVPVLVSKGVYIWDEIERSRSGWVCERSLDSLVVTLKEALNDPLERQARGDRARHYAQEHYNWTAIAGQLLPIYQTAARQPATHPTTAP